MIGLVKHENEYIYLHCAKANALATHLKSSAAEMYPLSLRLKTQPYDT